MIQIKVFANLRQEFGLKSGFKLDFDNHEKPITIKEILDYYKVDVEKIAIILVNGKVADVNTTVNDGDTVAFFSPVAGG
jgi:molybdopterin converting factor small subunit